jgi:anaerobic magnesium-protoporphyrin IX monomethyl ester cyclase
MTVLLVNPYHNGNAEIPPLGLEYLASSLLSSGIAAAIADLDVPGGDNGHGYLLSQLRRYSPDIVGVTAMSDSFKSARAVCQRIKDYSDGILTVVGGIHPTFIGEPILEECDEIDVVVRGEGEITFRELVTAHLQKKPLVTINGISFRDRGTIVTTGQRNLIKDLDALPLPAHDLVHNDRYRTRSISTSRGCFHSCTFCSIQSLYKRTLRLRSAESILEEIEQLIGLGAQRIMFTDDNFTFSFQRVNHLCGEIMRRGYHTKVHFFAEGRIDDVCKAPIMAQIMSDAGFRGLYTGAESGSQEILDFYEKKMTTDDVLRGVSCCIEQNLPPVVNFILCGPRDTQKTMLETIRLAKKIYENGAEIAYAEMLTPFPGTPIKDELEHDGKFRESEGVYYFHSYNGVDIERVLKLCTVARSMAYFVHGNDFLFSVKKPYFELSYLEELLEGEVPSEFAALYERFSEREPERDIIDETYDNAKNLLRQER